MKKLLILFLLLPFFASAQISKTWLIGQTGQIRYDSNRVRTGDTAAMLTPYLRKFDTTAMLTPYLRKVDTTAMLNPYLHEVDTTAMLLPYLRKIDTTAMLVPYLRKIDTTAMLGNYAVKDGSNATGTWPISITGNAATATALQTGRTIGTVTGDATSAGSSFDGTANNTNALTLATVNGNVGTFGSATQSSVITVNAKGLVTAASNSTVTPAVGSITGLGTSVATALAVNVGTAGAPVINGGVLGTPSSGTATNLSGTAASLTAGNVTTNANLTGPITSVGNATSIASQTGTGTTFVMSAGPTITGTLVSSAHEPASNNISDLGSTSKRWKDTWFTGTSTLRKQVNTATVTTDIVAQFNGMAAQSGDLTRWSNSVPTVLASVSSAGAFTVPSLNTGTLLDGKIFAKSTTAITLASTAHALTLGDEATGVNGAIGLYSTGFGFQGRSNGATAAMNINPFGGDVRFGIAAPTGVFNVTAFHPGAGTGDYVSMELRNGALAAADGLLMRILGTGFTTSGMNFQDGGMVGTGTNVSGGLSIGTQASADLRFYSNNTLRLTVAAAGTTTYTAPIVIKGYTVATLPAGVVGMIAYCTDLLTPTYLVAAVGGGAVTGPVFYNGTAWVSY